MKKAGSKNGFTLIELLVTISIIGVLAAILVANLVGARGRAKDAARKEGLNQLKTALRLFYNDNQRYPASVPGSRMSEGCSGSCTEGVQFGTTTVYMNSLPTHNYWQRSSGEGFVIRVVLDNASDESIPTSYAKCCSSAPGANGCPVDAATSLASKFFIMCED